MRRASETRYRDGAVAIVTGGASGIGLALATALVESGGHVLLLDLREDWLAEAERSLGPAPRPEHSTSATPRRSPRRSRRRSTGTAGST